MMKNMPTSSNVPVIEPIKVLTDGTEVACTYCEGAHLFEECSANHVFVNYMGNNNHNNPYSNTYNLGWRNHPNVL